MSEVEYANEVSTIDSIVLGAFEKATNSRGLNATPEVKNYLISQVRHNLDEAHSKGQLEARRAQIEENTEVLVQRLAALHATEIRIDHLSDALDWLCSRYEYFFPFCPRQ
jgi:hypothetical protein